MSSLAQVLERFNRKERNLLVRAILGHKEKPLRLSPRFRQQVGDKLGFPIPEDAWWATDYHISSLAGALAIFMTDGAGLQKSYENRAVNKRKLVEGNQEDIDLVIATDQHLILIEAKAHGAWDNAQLRSKLARLNLLHEFCKTLELVPQRALCFHLLLVSPTRPQHLKVPGPSWGPWNGEIPWLELRLDPTISILEVTQCDQARHSMAAGTFWCVMEHPVRGESAQEVQANLRSEDKGR